MAKGAFYNSETAATDSSKILLAVYDGNGNLHGMLNTTSVGTYAVGSFVAAFEFDAFGQTVRESGPYASEVPFRYSTKYTDTESGLVYYGMRFYSPSLGRFINRDPSEESGGINLYGFVDNNGVNRWDYQGLGWERLCTVIEVFVSASNASMLTYIKDCQDIYVDTSTPGWNPTTVITDGPRAPTTPTQAPAPLPGPQKNPDAPNKTEKPKVENDCTRAYDAIRNGIPALPDTGRLAGALAATGINSDNTMLALAGFESLFDPEARNPRSSAAGMFQILDRGPTSTKRDIENRVWPKFVSSSNPLMPSDAQGDWRLDPSTAATGAYVYLLDRIASAKNDLVGGLGNYHGGSASSNQAYATGVLGARDVLDDFSKQHGGNLREALEKDCDKIKAAIGGLH